MVTVFAPGLRPMVPLFCGFAAKPSNSPGLLLCKLGWTGAASRKHRPARPFLEDFTTRKGFSEKRLWTWRCSRPPPEPPTSTCSRTPSLAGLGPVGRGSPPRRQHGEEPSGTPAPRGREPQPALAFATWATSGEPLHLGFEPQFLPL